MRWVQKSQRRTDDFPMLEENDCWIFPAGLRPFAPPYKANSGPPVIFAFAHHPVRGLRKYEKERQLCDGNKISKENEIIYSLLGPIDYTKNMKKWSHSLDKISKGHKKSCQIRPVTYIRWNWWPWSVSLKGSDLQQEFGLSDIKDKPLWRQLWDLSKSTVTEKAKIFCKEFSACFRTKEYVRFVTYCLQFSRFVITPRLQVIIARLLHQIS